MRVSSKYGPIYKSFCRLDLVGGMVDDVEDIVVAIDAISGKAIDDCVDGLIIECDLCGNGIDNDVINRFWWFDIIVVGSIWFCSKLVDFDKFGPMVEVDSIGVVIVSNQKDKNVNAIEKKDDSFFFGSENCSNSFECPANIWIRLNPKEKWNYRNV